MCRKESIVIVSAIVEVRLSVKAADRSVEEGNLKPLEHLVDRDKQAELEDTGEAL